MKTGRLEMRVSLEFLEALDRVRGEVPRATFIQRELRGVLGLGEEAAPSARKAPVEPRRVSPPASAQSSYVKPFVPRPKGK